MVSELCSRQAVTCLSWLSWKHRFQGNLVVRMLDPTFLNSKAGVVAAALQKQWSGRRHGEG